MKGQFMLISSILVGVIVISTASSISDVQNQDFSSQEMSSKIVMIKEDVKKVDHTKENEINEFKEMVSMIDGVDTQTEHWDRLSEPDCFNVTLRTSNQEANLNCIR